MAVRVRIQLSQLSKDCHSPKKLWGKISPALFSLPQKDLHNNGQELLFYRIVFNKLPWVHISWFVMPFDLLKVKIQNHTDHNTQN